MEFDRTGAGNNTGMHGATDEDCFARLQGADWGSFRRVKPERKTMKQML